MTAMQITEFLLARIIEDEAALQPFDGGRPVHRRTGEVLDFHEGGELWEMSPSGEYLTMYVSPQRALAEVRAKQAIVDLHSYEWMGPDDAAGQGCTHDYEDWPCPTLRHLAAIYAHHPGYRPEWRP